MKKVFEQSQLDRIEQLEIIYVHENAFKEVFIGNVECENGPCIVFTPDEAILFAKEVIKVAKQIKLNL